MARRRSRAKRLFLFVALLLLALLLLELNRFLPGAWPGGGGSAGSRPVAMGTERDPSRVRPSPQPLAATPPDATVRVVVIAPPSDRASDAVTATAGGARAEARLESGRAEVRLPAAAARPGALRVERGGRRVTHETSAEAL